MCVDSLVDWLMS